MSNQKLYGSMLKCDGTTKNCEGCVFRKVPDCRNAMAHHAGALIQLQEVALDNVGAQSAAQEAEIRKLHQLTKDLSEGLQEVNQRLTHVVNGLEEERHCASCKHVIPCEGEMEEATREMICEGCKKEHSNWTLREDFGKPTDPCEGCMADTDESEGCQHNSDNE